MTISEMIKQLEILKEQLGDTDVLIATDTNTINIDCISVDGDIVIIESNDLIEDISARLSEAFDDGVSYSNDD